ncbi:hypothetical protein HPS36_02110 [Halorubrum salinarum]|uniref:Uncharacterized protein n=1 Tax=Halorubrum salinarum TaxID=2739057 RepID=A0A7D4BNX7_9EURY|nr:hypothetical protein [Halorubrum salinarum]QKG91697.1 hypothetical protein HPS36_02110 [Halorubrum salinarum]
MNRAQRRQQATERRQQTAQSLGTDPGEVRVQQRRNRNTVALSGEGEQDVRQAQTADSEYIRPDDLNVEDSGPGIEVGVAETARQDIASRVKQDVAGQSRFARPGDVAVEVTEAGVEKVDVDQAAIRSRRRAFEQRQARREAASELSDELGRDVDPSDIEISDGQATLADDAAQEVIDQQRSDLRSDAAEEFDVDPSQVEISKQDGELVAQADVERQFEQQFKGDPARGIPGVNVAREAARRQVADELGVEAEDVELSRQDGQVIAEADVPRDTLPSDSTSVGAGLGGNVDTTSFNLPSRSGSGTASTDTSTSPGALATVTGTAASTLANNPVGNAIGRGADALFGTDSPDSGVLGGVADRLDTEAEDINNTFADQIRESDPSRTQAVAPGVGGLSAAANSEFIRGSAATATELANPAAAGRDLINLGSAGAQVADFVADEGPEGAQVVLDAAEAGARAAPGAVVDVAQAARDNPQEAAEVGTAVVATGVAGGAGFRGVRGAASGARQLTRRLDADLAEFRRANRAQGQIGSQRSRDTVDFSDAQSGRDFEADLRQEDLTQRQEILRDQATREQRVTEDLVDNPRSADPIGTGGRGPTIDPDRPPRAGPSRPTTRTQSVGQNVPREMAGLQRANNVPTADLRTTVDVTPTATSTSGAARGAAAATGASGSRAPSQLVDADGSVIEPASGLDITTPRPATETGTTTATTTLADQVTGTQAATTTGTATASADAFLNQGLGTATGTRSSAVPSGVGLGTRPGVRTGLRPGQRVGTRTGTGPRQTPRSAAPSASRASSASTAGSTATTASERIARALPGGVGSRGRGRRGLPEFSADGESEEGEVPENFIESTFDNPIASVTEVERELEEFFERG